jgi:hypothetical protein
MEAQELPDGSYQVSMDKSEVVTLYELISRGEWSDDLDTLETVNHAEVAALSRLEMALLPLVTEAGTDAYGPTVKAAWERLTGS